MLAGKLIICDSNIPWHHNRYSKHHLMSRLARDNDVVFVNPQEDAIKFARRAGWRRLWGVNHRMERPDDEALEVFTPLSVPWRGKTKRLWPPDQRLFCSQLRSVTRRYPGRDLILFIGNPWNVFLLDAFPECRCSIYHCSDNFPALFSGGLRAEVERRETELIRRADLVVCSHPRLVDKCAARGGRTRYLPHAVDERFLRSSGTARNLPENLTGLRKPVIGFVGSLDRGVDLEMLRYAVNAHANRDFVFVGPMVPDCQETMPTLRTRSNCRILGSVAWAALPDYLAHLAVGLIPFHNDEFNSHRDPLKLYEYLAAGLTVVSTQPVANDALSDYVLVGPTPKEFAEQIGRAVALSTDEARRHKQIALMTKEHTWGRRVEQLSEMIEEALLTRGGQ